jgi:hypothetical protein
MSSTQCYTLCAWCLRPLSDDHTACQRIARGAA